MGSGGCSAPIYSILFLVALYLIDRDSAKPGSVLEAGWLYILEVERFKSCSFTSFSELSLPPNLIFPHGWHKAKFNELTKLTTEKNARLLLARPPICRLLVLSSQDVLV